MPVIQAITVALPITLGLVMIGTGGANFAGPSLARHNFALWGCAAGFYRVAGSLGAVIGLLLLMPLTLGVGMIASTIFMLTPGAWHSPPSRYTTRRRLEPDAILDALRALRAGEQPPKPEETP